MLKRQKNKKEAGIGPFLKYDAYHANVVEPFNIFKLNRFRYQSFSSALRRPCKPDRWYRLLQSASL